MAGPKRSSQPRSTSASPIESPTAQTTLRHEDRESGHELGALQEGWDKVLAIWHALLERWHITATPEPWAILLVATAVVIAVSLPAVWTKARQAATIVHEMGHAAVGYVFGRKIDGISLHTDTSGVTTSRGKPYGIGFLLSVLAGYPAPSLLGLGMIWAATTNWSGAALTLFAALMATALWLCQNIVGFLSCALAVAASGALWWWGTPTLVANSVLAVGIFMVIAGFRCCIDLWRAHQRGDGASSDAGQASTLTFVIPATGWIIFFFAVAVYSLFQSGVLLLAALTT